MSAADEAKDYTGGGVEIIPFDELEPQWHVPGAKEGGYLRWLTSWVGGPKGHINPNFGRSVISDKGCVGFMKLMQGCRQKGVHSHTVVEIYIILKGHIEGYDGLGETHRAGPMDCVYIPKGVPHGVRNCGSEDLDLLWIHDDIEKKGLSTYYYDEASTPRIGGVKVIPFINLEPQWAAPKAKEPPFLRYAVSWVGGQKGYINHNRGVAEESDKCTLGMLVIYPGCKQVPHSYAGNATYVIVEGTGMVDRGKGIEILKRLDGVRIPGGKEVAIRNIGTGLLWVLWTHERPQEENSVKYRIEA